MSEKKVGEVTHYFSRISVAVLDLSKPLHVGDSVSIAGEITDLQQTVTSMQVNYEDVEEGQPGREVAMKVDGPVRPGDIVYQLEEKGEREEEAVFAWTHSQNILCYRAGPASFVSNDDSARRQSKKSQCYPLHGAGGGSTQTASSGSSAMTIGRTDGRCFWREDDI